MAAREDTQSLIAEAVADFMAAVSPTNSNGQEGLKRLARALDRLSLAFHEGADIASAPSEAEPPEQDVQALRERIARLFPELADGLATQREGRVDDVVIGDAIDDLTSIASDLLDVAWCFENTSLDDATRLYRFGFSHQWGRLLCDVRSAVHLALFGM